MRGRALDEGCACAVVVDGARAHARTDVVTVNFGSLPTCRLGPTTRSSAGRYRRRAAVGEADQRARHEAVAHLRRCTRHLGCAPLGMTSILCITRPAVRL